MIESNKNEVKTATLDEPYDAEKSAVDKTYQSLSTRRGKYTDGTGCSEGNVSSLYAITMETFYLRR